MDLFRRGHDVYNQPVLEGISWDLLPVAAGIALVVIVVHLIYRLVRGKPGEKRAHRSIADERVFVAKKHGMFPVLRP